MKIKLTISILIYEHVLVYTENLYHRVNKEGGRTHDCKNTRKQKIAAEL